MKGGKLEPVAIVKGGKTHEPTHEFIEGRRSSGTPLAGIAIEERHLRVPFLFC